MTKKYKKLLLISFVVILIIFNFFFNVKNSYAACSTSDSLKSASGNREVRLNSYTCYGITGLSEGSEYYYLKCPSTGYKTDVSPRINLKMKYFYKAIVDWSKNKFDWGTETITILGNGFIETGSVSLGSCDSPTLSFSVSPTSISYNTAATLNWSSTSASSCTASGAWSGIKSVTGSASTGNLTSSKTYSLYCSGLGGTTTTKSVTVNVAAAPPLTCTGPKAITWTDSSITANATKVRKIHIDELRSWTNNLRIDAGLTNFSWTDSTITANVTKVRKIHIDELRQAISAVYTKCGQTPPSWTDSSITANVTKVRKIHIDELRNAVKNAK